MILTISSYGPYDCKLGWGVVAHGVWLVAKRSKRMHACAGQRQVATGRAGQEWQAEGCPADASASGNTSHCGLYSEGLWCILSVSALMPFHRLLSGCMCVFVMFPVQVLLWLLTALAGRTVWCGTPTQP